MLKVKKTRMFLVGLFNVQLFPTPLMAARAALNAGGEALRMRGIYEQALLHKWKWSRGGWEYPLFTATGTEMRPAVRRFKRLGLVAPRYLWLTSKSDQTGYYFAPSSTIKQQVAEQDGVLYVANGEPSTLSFRAAGMPNVVSWFGELNVPDTFADDCLKWGVKEVVNYPDPTGTRRGTEPHRSCTTCSLGAPSGTPPSRSRSWMRGRRRTSTTCGAEPNSTSSGSERPSVAWHRSTTARRRTPRRTRPPAHQPPCELLHLRNSFWAM